jgi:hypothetical protein
MVVDMNWDDADNRRITSVAPGLFWFSTQHTEKEDRIEFTVGQLLTSIA